MTIPLDPPPTADAAPSDPGAGPTPKTAPRNSDRFFLWIAGLGIARSDGWLGGVAAGIAARLRIDPLIVRGVLVVAALFSLPAIFLYAVAWALLPDADGRIHARDLLRRDYQPVQLGILATAVIGLIPTAPLTGSFFGLGYVSWPSISFFGWFIGLALVIVLVILIVRAASRTPGATASNLSMASTDSTAPEASVPLGDSGIAEGTDATLAETAVLDTESVQPVAPVPPAPLPPNAQEPGDIEAWRAQHAAWREQDQAWRRSQQDIERAARDQLRRERQAVAATFAAEAADLRRTRRAANPRAPFAFVASVIGLAIAVGAAVGLWAPADAAGALGLFCGALVLSIGMIIAGIARRRSGFLAFITALVLVGALVAGGFAAARNLTFGSAWIWNVAPAHVEQPFGELHINLQPHDGGPRPIVVDKGTGLTRINVDPGVQLDLSATLGSGTVSWIRAGTDDVVDTGTWPLVRQNDGTQTTTASVAAEDVPVVTIQTVTITQGSGDILVTIYEPTKEDQ